MPYYVLQLLDNGESIEVSGAMPKLKNGISNITMGDDSFQVFIDGESITIYMKMSIDLKVIHITDEEDVNMDELVERGIPYIPYSPHLESSYAHRTELVNNWCANVREYFALRWYREEQIF